ncbi:uncharacterized protein L969DRAFT_44018 [Mixia osmundae IAM 14324]|uniref:Uncharacterized protein n=1 Tax=Mixia osmundae (strain CBS 9802 / IAM 14324 / JCM 22182 / KY 12970) TaxID=764103 RepID=G7E3V1_MIXOS|nr:uncharacterized protein L969DRAFT_44018 [Mixia osmundae IAM 14324]KEI41956.1 hypothetical protein L969DRAFT_44018 [Mixia osmundae IAM 14324]GAA97511.1 hypothetical protein E5Q_04189 [Mixia osmundae IAM 14324]
MDLTTAFEFSYELPDLFSPSAGQSPRSSDRQTEHSQEPTEADLFPDPATPSEPIPHLMIDFQRLARDYIWQPQLFTMERFMPLKHVACLRHLITDDPCEPATVELLVKTHTYIRAFYAKYIIWRDANPRSGRYGRHPGGKTWKQLTLVDLGKGFDFVLITLGHPIAAEDLAQLTWRCALLAMKREA